MARALVLACLLLLGIAIRLPSLSQSVTGNHDFRQAVVMAHVLSLADEPVLSPLETFDTGPVMFDVPIYQLLAAQLSRLPGLEPIVATRIIGLLTFVATFIALQMLLSACRFPPWWIMLAEGFFATSPISVHYSMAPLPDNLAIALGLFSIVFLYRHRQNRRLRDLLFGVALGSVATLIKSPIYAFFIGGFLIHWLVSDAEWPKSLPLYMTLGVWFGGIAIGTELIRGAVLGQAATDGLAQSPVWYFGRLPDRWDWTAWWRIEQRWLVEYGNPVTAILSLVGLAASLRRRRTQDVFALAYLASSAAIVLVLFNVHRIHNYYQLPFLFIFYVLAAGGAQAVFESVTRSHALVPDQAARSHSITVYLVGGFLVLSALFALFHPMRGLAVTRPAYATLVQASVPESGFVYFADQNPSPLALYEIRRKGRKIATPEEVCDVIKSGGSAGEYLFLAPVIDGLEDCDSLLLGSEHAGPGWRLELDVSGIGRLYEAMPTFGSPAD